MQRKTKRAFRYLFPVTLFAACTLLFQAKSPRNIAEGKNFAQQKKTTEQPVSTGAKSLSIISHNPQNETKLQINAIDAVQICEGELALSNPSGIFENTKGLTELISKEARYHEEERKIKFYKNVNFAHHSGLIATTNHAVVDTKTQDIIGEEGIKAHHKGSIITANTFELPKAGNLIKFNGNVCFNISRK